MNENGTCQDFKRLFIGNLGYASAFLDSEMTIKSIRSWVDNHYRIYNLYNRILCNTSCFRWLKYLISTPNPNSSRKQTLWSYTSVIPNHIVIKFSKYFLNFTTKSLASFALDAN